MRCAFCHKPVIASETDKGVYQCEHCNTVQEVKLKTRPYIYTVGNHQNYEAV